MMKKSSLLNVLVILISLGGASFCAKLLIDDYNTKAIGDNKDVAGVLRESNTQVKRKLGDNLLWDKINKDTKLYWNDSIQTDEKSQAIITLNDGNEIKLGGASLVALEKDNGQLALSLKSGALLVDNKTGKPSVVSKIKVNGVTIDNSNSKTLALNLDNKNGELKAIETTADGKGKEITVSKDGKVEEKEIPATLQNPPALFRTWTTANEEKLSFAWTAKQPDTILEISSDKDFKKIFLKKEVSTGKFDTELDPGSYFWRVKIVNPATKAAVFSEERSLEIVQMKKPEPLTPTPKTKTVYRSELPAVEFSWKPADRANNYVLEVARDKDFKNIIHNAETTNTSYQTSKLAEGPVYWRVSAVYVNQRQPSSTSEFEISKLKEINPPTLLDPSPKFVLDYAGFSKNGGLPFKWKADLNETYKFVLSSTEDLKTEVSSSETTQTEILVKDKLRSGTYYWSVGYKNPEGKWTFKEIRRLEVDVLIPSLESPKLLTKQSEFDPDSEKVNLQWSSVPGAAKYHFKILKVDGRNEKLVFEENSAALEKTPNLEDGDYKYLVSSIDAAGRESKPAEKSFKVTRSPELDAPDFEMPEVQ